MLFAWHLREYHLMKTAIATPDQADVRVIVPAPALVDILDQLKLYDFNVPLLPAHYMPAWPADKPPPPAGGPTFFPAAIPLVQPTPMPQNPPPKQSKAVINLHSLPKLTVPVELTVAKLLAKKEGSPPKDGAGQQFCFAFHCKNICNSD